MTRPEHNPCPDCQSTEVDRRKFIKAAAGSVAAATVVGGPASAETKASTPETSVKHLFDSLTEAQRKVVCFDWDHQEEERGLLRSRVGNNWQITKPVLNGDFYSGEQREIVRSIYEGIIDPSWHKKFDYQLEDDAGGYGESQSIAIFGKPGTAEFEFVMTGRHMTMRCDGNSADHVAFGGPIFYGHDPGGVFDEEPTHPKNVFWEQAVEANKVYEMLDGKQRKLAEVKNTPAESKNAFRGEDGKFSGIPVSEMSSDQQEAMQKVLQKLIEPYRKSDRDEVVACLKAQGGIEKCHLAFYTDEDIGNDKVWDNWRLEGPSFVWYFRGSPHVHVWVNVADNANVKFNG